MSDQHLSPYQRVPECALDLGFLRSDYTGRASPYTPVQHRTVEGTVEIPPWDGPPQQHCSRSRWATVRTCCCGLSPVEGGGPPAIFGFWSHPRGEHDDGDPDEADGGAQVVEAVWLEAVHDDAPGE